MASDINVVVLVGRLVRDCEIKVTPGGSSVCHFSVAVNRRKKSGDTWTEEVNYFDVSLFGKTADALKPYLVKGRQVSVNGELRQDRWTTQDGQQRSKVEIYANNIQLLSNSGAGSGNGNDPARTDAGYDAASSIPAGPEAFEDQDDDIPF